MSANKSSKTTKNVISFLNMKGGVGKTTLCKETAYYFSLKKDRKVLVIDVDPQANCTQSFFERFSITGEADGEIISQEKKLKQSIENIFTKNKYGLLEDNVENTILELNKNLSIIPGALGTVFMERDTNSGQAEQKLTNFLNNNKLRHEYDYIFIDCPPTYSFYTVSALLASDYYFVPVKPDAYSLLGLDLLQRVIEDMRAAYLSNFKVQPINNLGVIFTLVDSSKAGYVKNIQQIRTAFKDRSVYFFDSIFNKKEKIATSKLSSFIADKNDTALMSEIDSICMEFEKRVSEMK